VKQAVSQPLGLGFREVAGEEQRLGPDEQVVRDQDKVEPHLVEGVVVEGELAQAGVFVVADVVFDVGALAVAALEDLEASAVVGHGSAIAWDEVQASGRLHARVSFVRTSRSAQSSRPGQGPWQ